MTPGQQYRYETLTIAAGSTKDLPVGGDWIYVHSSTRGAKFRFDSGPPVPFWSKQLYELQFETVTIVNDTGFSFTFTYLIGRGPALNVQERRATVRTLSPVIRQSIGAGSKTQVMLLTSYGPPDRVLLCIPTGEANGLQIGDSTVAFNSGLYLPVGVPLAVNTQSDVYAYNNGGASVVISAMVEQI